MVSISYQAFLLMLFYDVYAGEFCQQVDDEVEKQIHASSSSITKTYALIEMITTISRTTCSHHCGLRDTCNGVKYTKKESANNCNLYQSVLNEDANQLIENDNIEQFIRVDEICSIDLPTHGGWSEWFVGQCSVSCGGGSLTSTRSCDNPAPKNGGINCYGSSFDTKSCQPLPCPVNGGWSEWTPAEICSMPCNGGTQLETRLCNSPAPEDGGADCGVEYNRTSSCNEGACGGVANLGKGKQCVQSTTFTGSTYAGCDVSVDGNPNPDWGAGQSCSGTNFEQNAWWQLDLEIAYFISFVRIVARGDCCQDRFNNINIYAHMLSHLADSGMKCYGDIMTSIKIARSYACTQPTYGRYLVIKKETPGQLEMCEVSVYVFQ